MFDCLKEKVTFGELILYLIMWDIASFLCDRVFEVWGLG